MASGSLSVLFDDFSRAYVFVNRTPTTVLRDPLSNKPYIGLYTTRRVAGAVTNSEAVKALKFAAS
jgi:HK97 family phage major capsid protein